MNRIRRVVARMRSVPASWEPIQRFWYLLLPDDRTLSSWTRGSDGMLLSCVTIVGQRELPQSFERDRYEHIWTHAHALGPSTSARFGIRATRCLNLINSLMRSRRECRVNSHSKPDYIKYHYNDYSHRSYEHYKEEYKRGCVRRKTTAEQLHVYKVKKLLYYACLKLSRSIVFQYKIS